MALIFNSTVSRENSRTNFCTRTYVKHEA